MIPGFFPFELCCCFGGTDGTLPLSSPESAGFRLSDISFKAGSFIFACMKLSGSDLGIDVTPESNGFTSLSESSPRLLRYGSSSPLFGAEMSGSCERFKRQNQFSCT